MKNLQLSRRSLLIGGAAAPLAAGLGVAAPSFANGQSLQPSARHNSFNLGDFGVATLLAGTRAVDEDIQSTFGVNVSPDEFAEVSAANFIPADKTQFFFTPTVVNTGSDVVLFDTGLSAEGTTGALAGTGLSPEDVTVVVITHMHGDHIGGMTDEAGNLTYPNARYVTGQVEFDHWAAQENERFDQKIKPFAERFAFIGGGEEVTPGITSVEAFGHTPGHMGYMVESNGAQLMLIADLANHYVWSVGYPDWEVRFDMDLSLIHI